MSPTPSHARLGPDSDVCALIPHYESRQWLSAAIESLLEQTRPPDAVIVIDDASAEPPVDLVSRYPPVTLLVADENVGPYRLVQTVIDDTDFDAYLFQDADDFSHPVRLQRLLEHAAASGADMVGSFEIRVDATTAEARPVEYPEDVNQALEENPIAFALLHPTSLVARPLVDRAGGYPGGLRFGGDVDFLWRAAHAGRVVNVAEHLYFRRVGHESLSASAGTGLRSPARRQLDAELRRVARRNAAVAAAGAPVERRSFAPGPPVALRRLAGPEPGTRRQASTGTGSPTPCTPPGDQGPVVVIGAPRAGTDLLMWALDQHPAFRAVPDGRWLGDVAAALGSAGDANGSGPDAALRQVRAAVRTALDGGSPRPVFSGPQLTAAALEIFALDRGARFIHVVRDPEAAVASLREAPLAGGDFYAGDAAAAACRKLSAIGRMLEAVLPPESVLRVDFDALVERPAAGMRRCLDFLGVPSLAACARLLGLDRSRSATSSTAAAAGPTSLGGDDSTGTALASHLRSWRRRQLPGTESLAQRLRGLVDRAVPPEAVVSVVSRGDSTLLTLDTKQARHFPEAPGGGYAGEYPATSGEAIELLESARRRGTTHLCVPAPGLWWLSFYADLARHLEQHYEVVAFEQGTGIIFRLAASPDAEAVASTRAALRAARRLVIDGPRPAGRAS